MSTLAISSEDAERYVISSMLRSAGAAWEVLGILRGEDFELLRHELITDAVFALLGRSEPIDPISVVAELQRTQTISQAGGIGYVHELHGYASTATNVGYYAGMVREAAQRRRLREAGAALAVMAEDASLEVSDLTDKSRQMIDGAIGLVRSKSSTSGEVLADVIANLGSEVMAMPTPWGNLTRQIQGFMPGKLYIFGARPGIGKSALALQCAEVLELGGHVGFFTLEMGKEEVTKRIISQQTDIAATMLKGNTPLPEWAQSRVEQWAEAYTGRILFDERGSLTIGDIRAQIRTWSREHKLSGVVVDYLQLVSGPAGQSRVEIVGEVSRQLKLLSREFDIPIIALSQLNRNSEQRADRRPALSDLRESGSIEQDADVVILIHREMGLTDEISNNLELILAKNRQGATGVLDLHWQGEFIRAVEYA